MTDHIRDEVRFFVERYSFDARNMLDNKGVRDCQRSPSMQEFLRVFCNLIDCR